MYTIGVKKNEYELASFAEKVGLDTGETRDAGTRGWDSVGRDIF